MIIDSAEVLAWLAACGREIAANRAYLTELDAAIGDADHGENMDRGFRAVAKKLPELAGEDIGSILKTVGMTLLSTVGGAGGPLYGTFFLQAGLKAVGKAEIGLAEWAAMLDAALEGVARRGRAQVGDKTMLDALAPAVRALQAAVAAGQALPAAMQGAAAAAQAGMEGTVPLVARRGRASYLGERSAGHQDPGATSSYLLLKAAAETWAEHGRAGSRLA